MKIVTYTQNGRTSIGYVVEQEVIDLSAVAPDMLQLIQGGIPANVSGARVPLVEAVLLAPIPTPKRNIMCLGLNYAEHAAESYAARGRQAEVPQFPIIFTKATTSVNGPYADIPYDPTATNELDWEAELGVVIGKKGKNIGREEAMSYVFGYTVLNDVTGRDLQRNHKQYFKGKSLDGCCPMGPWIVTADSLPNPHNLHIACRVNGETKQQSHTSLMIFDIPTIISTLSRGMTLLPGDIIATGTPSGVGFARTPPQFLQPGDVVECEIEGIGLIRNLVVLS